MAARLIALRLPPGHVVDALRRIWADGDAVLPLPWDSSDASVHRTVQSLRPDQVLTADTPTKIAPREGVHDPLPDDAALVVATSGSTDPPKGVVLTHAALTASTTASLARLGAAHGERFTLALPLHHVAGIQILLRSRACGTDAEVLQRPDSRAIAAATGDHLSLVPTQLSRLLDDGVDLSGWHTILLGGARARPELLERARAAGASVVTSYGMTETCGGCVYDGLPLDSIEVARRDDGRITMRGPVLFSGYLGNPDATSAAFDDDGWFVTGDLGTFTDGRLEVAGRADDVIVSGGENVSAGAVAEVLRGDPRILDVAVIGAPDPQWGEVVVALTVPRDPDDPPRLEDLSDRVRQVLPPTHAPRRLVLVDGLPRDGMGKLVDTRLRPLLSSDTAQPDTRCRPHP